MLFTTFVVGITFCLLFTDISSFSTDGIIKDLTLKKNDVTGFKTINNNAIISQLEIPIERHSMSINLNTDLKSNSEYDDRTRKLYLTDNISTKHYSDHDLAVTSLPLAETSMHTPSSITTENTHNVSTTEGVQRMMSRVKFQQSIFNSIGGFSYNDDTTNKQTIITRNNYPVIINNIDAISKEFRDVRFQNRSEHLPSSTVSVDSHASTGKKNFDTTSVPTSITTSASTSSPPTTSTTTSSTTFSSTSATTSSSTSASTSSMTSDSTSATTTSSTSASTSATTATSTFSTPSYMKSDWTPTDIIPDATTTQLSFEATSDTDRIITVDDVYRKNDVTLPPIQYGDSLKLKPYTKYNDVTKYPYIDHPSPVYSRGAQITYANVDPVISSDANRMSSGNDWYNVIDQGYDEAPPTTTKPSTTSSPMTEEPMINLADHFDTHYVQQSKKYHEQKINQYKNEMAPYSPLDQIQQRGTYGSYNTHFFTESLPTTTTPAPRYKPKWRPGIPFSYQNVESSGTGLQKINGFRERMIVAPLQTQRRTELISKSENVDLKMYPINHESNPSKVTTDSFSSSKTTEFSNMKHIPAVYLPKIEPVSEKRREIVTDGSLSHKKKYKTELKLETKDKIIEKIKHKSSLKLTKIAAIRLLRKKIFLSKLKKLKNNPLALRKAISILKAKRDGQ